MGQRGHCLPPYGYTVWHKTAQTKGSDAVKASCGVQKTLGYTLRPNSVLPPCSNSTCPLHHIDSITACRWHRHLPYAHPALLRAAMVSPPSAGRLRKLPAPWNELYTGREVKRTSNGRTIKGRVRHYALGGLTMGHHHPASLDKFGLSMEDKFLVEWEDGRKEALCREELAQLATQRFVDEEWVLPVVRYLQKVRRGASAGPDAGNSHFGMESPLQKLWHHWQPVLHDL